mgnify:CR=1 FL=1
MMGSRYQHDGIAMQVSSRRARRARTRISVQQNNTADAHGLPSKARETLALQHIQNARTGRGGDRGGDECHVDHAPGPIDDDRVASRPAYQGDLSCVMIT